METVSWRDFYLAELGDLHDAEQQILLELPLMAASATSSALRDAFDEHYRQTQQHLERLEGLFAEIDERPRQTRCRAIRTLIEDGRLRVAGAEPGEIRDAALIAAAERIEHFEIASYRTARAYASRVDDGTSAALLDETLTEEIGMAQRLSTLASPELAAASDDRTPLMPGVWMTETSGFAAVPPRAGSDFGQTVEAADDLEPARPAREKAVPVPDRELTQNPT
jgi:ferritin-like metal-binding protein YciE